MNVFGQAGGFENLVVRLSPLETPPAPVAESGSLPPLQAASPSTPLSLSADGEVVATAGVGVVGGGGGKGGVKTVASPDLVPLEALRSTLVAVSSVRPLLARRVARAVLHRTATAVASALKR